ncbi:5910_t:CDS:2 [Funneliformis geosporum]|uniref:7470_t:CDS:1 n=1 Tax=Funneliformis geosporum TaxID=1117311 RepID=A0A9W4SMZ2_9GLOM|nr:7470_t:CDS:2 [Funneliformis geosporum]CAI2187351.1 5910_t:CDS:2 [Funneliformis geosporum]
MSWRSDIRIIIGLDFGTTFSGFAYCHVSDANDICTNDKWPGEAGQLKTNTILQYDSNFTNVVQWGNPALSKRPSRRNRNEPKPIELFKLHLGNLQENLRPKLPVDYKKAITDYLREFGKLINVRINERWTGINFTEHVLLVLTVPAEYTEKDKAIMRECAFNAKLIGDKCSQKLQFTTEPEAAALYCMENKLKEYDLLTTGTTFMIVDCGGGTVDLTTRKLIGTKQLGEITERIGDFCGSTFIDKGFVEFLRGKLGSRAIDLLMENQYGQFQYIVQDFCRRVKMPFTGEDEGFLYELDIEETAPILLQYVSKETKNLMEDNEWLIEIKYNDVKKMFDPIIDRIIRMIHIQLSNNQGACSAMFIVGGFGQSKYLQKRIKKEFQHRVKTISIPNQPVAAIVRGATIYGLSLKNSSNTDKMNNLKFMISTRRLKYTYGVRVSSLWKEGDPLHRKDADGRMTIFRSIVKRGTEVKVDQEFSSSYLPVNPTQTGINFLVYYTTEYDATYCDDPGVELLGTLRIDLPDVHLACDRPVTFGFSFGQMEITAFAKNELNGQNFQTKFDLLNDP